MSDSYPSTLSIEIDRPRLKSYLQAVGLLDWTAPSSFVGVFLGVAVGTTPKAQAIALHMPPLLNSLAIVAAGIGIGFAVGFLITFIPYLIFRHRRAARFAESFEVSVEGAFLRLRGHDTAWTDRKLHFRAIVDYEVAQSSLMRRFGIHTLLMTTLGGYRIEALGVKDCFKVRDMLSEIDHLRENQ